MAPALLVAMAAACSDSEPAATTPTPVPAWSDAEARANLQAAYPTLCPQTDDSTLPLVRIALQTGPLSYDSATKRWSVLFSVGEGTTPSTLSVYEQSGAASLTPMFCY